MAIGNHITLVRTVPNIPWYNALGILQNLNPSLLRSMANTPNNEWYERGLLLPFKVKQIQKHNVGSRPLATLGITNWSARGITVDSSNNINREGNVTQSVQYQTAQYNITAPVVADGCFYQSVFWTIYIYREDDTDEFFISMSSGYNVWTDLAIRQRRTDTGAETSLSFNNGTPEPSNRNRYVGDSLVGNAFQIQDFFYGGILFSACSFDFELSTKLFKNLNALKEYQTTGNTEDEIGVEKKIPPSKDHISTLYFYCQERRGTNPVDFEEWHNHSIRFLVENTTSEGDPLNWQSSVIAYLDYGEGASKYSDHKIVKFHQNGGTIIKCEELINGAWLERAQPQLDIPFSAYRVGMQCTDGYTYVGDIQTNMMIFKSLEDYNEWKENPRENTWGILENVLSNALVNTTMNTNNINFDVGLGECWILDQNNIKRMANLFNMQLNADLSNIVGNMLIGLGMYDNPVDVVCDLFVLPFDVTEFVTSELSEFALGIQPQEDEG